MPPLLHSTITDIYQLMHFPFHRPKHPTKVHVWAGITKKGQTGVCIFDGIMKKELYTKILGKTLVPFLQKTSPDGHKFMQDNDPKHVSGHTQYWMERNNINWWRTRPESPDLNPIENLWHELKEFIRREVKPRHKGIIDFWKTVDQQKYIKYINHLQKVVPRVIEVDGQALVIKIVYLVHTSI